LMGKIDLFDLTTGRLTERKNSVTAVYDGFRYQIYAQYFSLVEMGYRPQSLCLYSKKSNTTYDIPVPDEAATREFESLIQRMKSFRLSDAFSQNPAKCIHCIYNPICDYNPEDNPC
jgi:CRISPR-associated exonuclease Cas4